MQPKIRPALVHGSLRAPGLGLGRAIQCLARRPMRQIRNVAPRDPPASSTMLHLGAVDTRSLGCLPPGQFSAVQVLGDQRDGSRARMKPMPADARRRCGHVGRFPERSAERCSFRKPLSGAAALVRLLSEDCPCSVVARMWHGAKPRCRECWLEDHRGMGKTVRKTPRNG